MEEKNISSEASADVKQTEANSETGNSQPVEEQKEQKAETKYIPYDRFKEVIEKKNQYEQRLQELEQMLKQKEEEELAEKEEFKTLYEKTKEELERYKPIEEKAKKYEEVVSNLANQEIEQVKQTIGEEKFNELVELLDLENLEPLQLLEKLPKIKKLAGLTKPQVSGGQPIQQGQQLDAKKELEILKEKIRKGTITGKEMLRYKELTSELFKQ